MSVGASGSYDLSSVEFYDVEALDFNVTLTAAQMARLNVEVRGWEKPSDHAPAWIELG